MITMAFSTYLGLLLPFVSNYLKMPISFTVLVVVAPTVGTEAWGLENMLGEKLASGMVDGRKQSVAFNFNEIYLLIYI